MRSLLRTNCIRKDDLIASGLPSFPPTANGTEKEHFVQLSVIIREHHAYYQDSSFRDGVEKLMILRDHFNFKRNIFCVQSNVNDEKELVTRRYLRNHRHLPSITSELWNYIHEAAPRVHKHIDRTKDVHIRVLKKLNAYVDWLESLPLRAE